MAIILSSQHFMMKCQVHDNCIIQPHRDVLRIFRWWFPVCFIDYWHSKWYVYQMGKKKLHKPCNTLSLLIKNSHANVYMMAYFSRVTSKILGHPLRSSTNSTLSINSSNISHYPESNSQLPRKSFIHACIVSLNTLFSHRVKLLVCGSLIKLVPPSYIMNS